MHNQITLDLTVLSKPLKYSTDQTPRNEENKLNSKIQYRHENAEKEGIWMEKMGEVQERECGDLRKKKNSGKWLEERIEIRANNARI